MQDVTKSYDSSAHWLYQTEMEPGDCCVFRFIGLIEIVPVHNTQRLALFLFNFQLDLQVLVVIKNFVEFIPMLQ